jgi:hypothetical protein
VAATLRKESGVEVEVVDGDRSEFTVLADGREVLRKGDALPTVDAVRDALTVGSAAATAGDD